MRYGIRIKRAISRRARYTQRRYCETFLYSLTLLVTLRRVVGSLRMKRIKRNAGFANKKYKSIQARFILTNLQARLGSTAIFVYLTISVRKINACLSAVDSTIRISIVKLLPDETKLSPKEHGRLIFCKMA